MGRIFTILTAGFLGLATLAPATPAAAATNSYTIVTVYEWATVYESRCEPYTRVVTLYDHCGTAYTVPKTYYRTVEVPVKKLIAVKKVVPCY